MLIPSSCEPLLFSEEDLPSRTDTKQTRAHVCVPLLHPIGIGEKQRENHQGQSMRWRRPKYSAVGCSFCGLFCCVPSFFVWAWPWGDLLPSAVRPPRSGIIWALWFETCTQALSTGHQHQHRNTITASSHNKLVFCPSWQYKNTYRERKREKRNKTGHIILLHTQQGSTAARVCVCVWEREREREREEVKQN